MCVCVCVSNAVSTCSGEVANGRFHSECSRAVGTTCPFTCNRGYGAVTKDPVVCQHNLHWSPNPDQLCKGQEQCLIDCFFASNPIISVRFKNFS